nr:MAG: polyprotein [Robin hepatovirus 2]
MFLEILSRLLRGMLGLANIRETSMAVKKIIEDLGGILGLNDPDIEMEGKSDRITVGGSVGFTTVDQGSISTAVTGHVSNEQLRSAVDIPGSKETQGERFFLVKTFEWGHGKAYLDLVDTINVVSELKKVDHAVSGLLIFHKYGRFGLDIVVQINPTPFQQGGLIAYLVPSQESSNSFGALTMYPHIKLNCNINNMGRMKVPFVYTRGMYDFHNAVYEPWRLNFRVLAPLEIPEQANTECTVNVLARFTDLELHGLTPLTAVHDYYSQMMRNEVRISSSSNVVNLSNVQDSRAKMTFAIDQEKVMGEEGIAGGTEVSNLRVWTDTPGIITHFPYNASHEAGKIIFTIPVSPYWFHTNVGSGLANTGPHPSPLASVAQMFGYWRGDMVYHFEIFPSKFHSGRLLVLFVPGNEETDVSKITMLQATNGYCATMDVNGTASTLVFRVPWVSDTPYRTNTLTSSQKQDKVWHAIGKLVVFAYSKLRCPSTVAQHVWITLYASAVNLDLMAPLYHALKHDEDSGHARTMAGGDGFSTAPEIQQHDENPPGVENVPELTPPTGAVTSIEDPVLARKKPETFPQVSPGVVRHKADHMDMRKFMGRAHYYTQFTFNKNNNIYTFPIMLQAEGSASQSFAGTLRWFFSLFHLYRGAMDLTIVISGASDVDGVVWFTPKGLTVSKWWEEASPSLYADWKASLGVVRFNSRRTGNLQIRIPYYSDLPALSAHVPVDGDKTLGSISIQIMNYTQNDEFISFALYLAMSEESRFFFPRSPFRSERINSAEIQSVEQEPREGEDLAFDEYRSRAVESAPYKPLRMEVGKWRLKYAKEELEKPVAKEKKKSRSLVDLLSQAGADFEDGAMVTKISGGLALRGFVFCGKVYFADADPKSARMVPLFKYGKFKCEDVDNSWLTRNNKLDVSICRHWASINLQRIEFNFKKFMDGDVFLDESVYKTLDSTMNGKLENVLNVMRPVASTIVDRIVGESVVAKDVQQDIKNITSECSKFIETMNESVRKFAKSLSARRAGMVCRVIMTLVKSGAALYVCQRANWEAHVLIPMLSSIAIDVGMMACDVKASIAELFGDALKEVGGDDLKTQSLAWLRDVTAGITIFKAARDGFTWLIEKIKDWYSRRYGKKKKELQALKEVDEEFEKLVLASDEYCVKQIQDSTKEVEWKNGCDLLRKLRTLSSMTSGDSETRKIDIVLRDTIARVHAKIKSLGTINHATVVRPEPVVVYLSGDRGGGKSLLSMCLAVKICKFMGVDHNENIYTRAIGSEYWDGYAGQLVCVIDDMGQRSDDEDWVDFCQLVSGCPMRLNMAAVEEKGKHFVSPVIICTSNLSEPSPKTVYVKDAILRRLHLRLKVAPRKEYSRGTRSLDVQTGLLNVEKAKLDNKMSDMSCLHIVGDDGEYSVDQIVQAVCGIVCKRKANMNEFMDLWAQSDDDYGEALRRLLRTQTDVEPVGKFAKLFKTIKDHPVAILGTVLAMMGVVGVMIGGYKVYKHFAKKAVVTEGAYNKQNKPMPVVKLHMRDLDAMSVIEVSNLIRKNLIRFGVGDDEDHINWVLNGLGVKDDWIIVPSHGYKFDRDDCRFFFIEKNETIYCIQREKVEIMTPEAGFTDVVLMRIPGVQPFRNIIEHFVKKDDLQKCDKKQATLCTVNQGIFQMISEGAVRLEDAIDYRHQTIDGKDIMLHVNAVWRGRGEAAPGSCGGALVSSNNKLQNPVIGIHIAGGRDGLIAKCVWREMFDVIDSRILQSQRITKCEFISQRLHMGSKTKFRKSPLHPYIRAEINIPALMPYDKGADIDPMQIMLSKYGLPYVKEPQWYGEAMVYMVQKLRPVVEKTEQRFLTLPEAVAGIEGMDSIDMNTSPGLPYVLQNLSKKDLIKEVEAGVLYYFHPTLMAYWMMANRCMEKGFEIECVFATCAKDELRPVEKVKAGNTRAIECAPLHFTLLVRQVWGTVIGALQSNPGWHTGIAVGCDPDGDWDPIFKYALRFADYGIDLDFKNFDASLSPFMIERGCQVMGALAGMPHDWTRSISNAICYSQHMIGNMIYHVTGGMPSGIPCTSLLNSVINQMNVYFVLAKIYNATYSEVHENFRVLCYGDDILILVSKEQPVEHGLCNRIQQEFFELGMTVTGADKGDVRIARLTELTFLKRGFTFEAGRFYPDMSERTIWSMLAWLRTNAELEDNITTATWMMFLKSNEKGRKFYYGLKQLNHDFKLGLVLKPIGYYLSRKARLDHTRAVWEDLQQEFDV